MRSVCIRLNMHQWFIKINLYKQPYIILKSMPMHLKMWSPYPGKSAGRVNPQVGWSLVKIFGKGMSCGAGTDTPLTMSVDSAESMAWIVGRQAAEKPCHILFGWCRLVSVAKMTTDIVGREWRVVWRGPKLRGQSGRVENSRKETKNTSVEFFCKLLLFSFCCAPCIVFVRVLFTKLYTF